MKKLEKLFFESRFFFYGYTLGLSINVILAFLTISLFWHLPIVFILTPFVFWLDSKYIKRI